MPIISATTAKQNVKNYKDSVDENFATNHADLIADINLKITQASTKGKTSIDIEILLKENLSQEEFDYLTKELLEKDLKYKVISVKGMKNFTISWKAEN